MEFRGRELIAAQLNGDDLDPDGWQYGRIQLSGLRADNTLVVEGRMAVRSDGEGLHRHVDPAGSADLPVRDVVPRRRARAGSPASISQT